MTANTLEHTLKDANPGISLMVQGLNIRLAVHGTPGLIPGWGAKIPHATEQLSPHARTTELVCHNGRFHRMQQDSECSN